MPESLTEVIAFIGVCIGAIGVLVVVLGLCIACWGFVRSFRHVPQGEASFSGTLTPIPEPATGALWLVGLGLVAAARRRRG